MTTSPAAAQQTGTNGQYATVNGLKMYYETYGQGKPLVLIHGGGSTIGTSFSALLPLLAPHYKIIAVELQAHGHTPDRGKPTTFEQDADDVAALVRQLHLEKASFFGFSNGANTAMQIGMRHPRLVDKLVLLSGFYKREGMQPWFWDMMKDASLASMPQPLKDAYLAITHDPAGLQVMHDQDVQRMVNFKDWKEEDIRKITAPSFVIASDADVMTPEHTVALYRLLPKGKLAILPGVHGECLGEICVARPGSKMPAALATMVDEFLQADK
ncbi:MAG: alpha/beta hydrolase [Bacteroidetes bacterium]|nr:alpha/beta hydrolase [Bacteroidota bacterium]